MPPVPPTVSTPVPDPVPRHSFRPMLAMLVLGLLLGLGIGWWLGHRTVATRVGQSNDAANALKESEQKVADLQKENDLLKATLATFAQGTSTDAEGLSLSQIRQTWSDMNDLWTRWYYPRDLIGSSQKSTASTPLGNSDSYSVEQTMFVFPNQPGIRILLATDNVVYDNFFRRGNLAITPDPNSLAPGNPTAVNLSNFCAKVVSADCRVDDQAGMAEFTKTYPKTTTAAEYRIHGFFKAFSVGGSSVGTSASGLFIRLDSASERFAPMARQILLSATQ